MKKETKHRSRLTILMITFASMLLLGIAPNVQAGEAKVCKTSKVMFVLTCRSDLTHDQCMAEWDGDQHIDLVKKVPHLIRHSHNETTMNLSPDITPTDGIGELWFRNESDMFAALQSPQFDAAFKDAARFLDLSKTYGIVVEEVFEIGPVGPFCRGDE